MVYCGNTSNAWSKNNSTLAGWNSTLPDEIAHLKSSVVIGPILVKQLLPVKLTCLSGMATELSRELFSWRYFVVSTRYGTWNYQRSGHVDRQIEVNTDEQPMSSTQQADYASAVGDNIANADSVELKRLHDLNFNKNTKRSTNRQCHIAVRKVIVGLTCDSTLFFLFASCYFTTLTSNTRAIYPKYHKKACYYIYLYHCIAKYWTVTACRNY